MDGVIHCDADGDDGETSGNGGDVGLPQAQDEAGDQGSED
jgi:hypothetical protein